MTIYWNPFGPLQENAIQSRSGLFSTAAQLHFGQPADCSCFSSELFVHVSKLGDTVMKFEQTIRFIQISILGHFKPVFYPPFWDVHIAWIAKRFCWHPTDLLVSRFAESFDHFQQNRYLQLRSFRWFLSHMFGGSAFQQQAWRTA